jgi:hypothetical protein
VPIPAWAYRTTAAASSPIHANYYSGLTEEDRIMDSGCGENMGKSSLTPVRREAVPTGRGKRMISATNHVKESIATDEFDLPPGFTAKQRRVNIFADEDLHMNLMSTGQICADGTHRVVFDNKHCDVIEQATEKVVMRGRRNPTTNLYYMPAAARNPTTNTIAYSMLSVGRDAAAALRIFQSTNKTLTACSAYEEQAVPALIRYLHACAGYPTKATWIKAINAGYYITWPGLTAARVRQFLPKSEETAAGHMTAQRSNVRTTKPPENSPELRSALQKVRNLRLHLLSTKELEQEWKHKTASDQTGRFPLTSRRGHKYIMILYDYDTNYIFAEPIKSRETDELVRAYTKCHDILTKRGFTVKYHKMDNETSKLLAAAIAADGVSVEYAPPNDHKTNIAERMIQTFKAHFISVLFGTDNKFPDDCWDELIDGAVMQLNMLRPCTIKPEHSAYSFIFGPHDFNKVPIAPLGSKVMMHEGKYVRGTWSDRGIQGFFIKPAHEHYRCYQCLNPATNGIRTTNSIEIFPKCGMPATSSLDRLHMLLADLTDAIKNQHPPRIDEHAGTDYNSAIITLQRLTQNFDDEPSQTAEKPIPIVARRRSPRLAKSSETVSTGGANNRYSYPKRPHRIGTKIINNKRFTNNTGRITDFEKTTGLYTVEFEDLIESGWTHDEITLAKPRNQPKKIAALTGTFDTSIYAPNFFPKASPSTNYAHARDVEERNYSEFVRCFNANLWDPTLKKFASFKDFLNHPDPSIRNRWLHSGENEYHRLSKDGMGVLEWIRRSDVPKSKMVTYPRIVVDYRPEKDEPWRTRITAGGNLLKYDGITTAHTASMETIKCHINSIISDKNARAATADISNMYLCSDLPESEYVRFHRSTIPQSIIDKYNIEFDGDYAYAKINKAWYGLKQAGKIAHDDIVNRLAAAGYVKSTLIEGYFSHKTRPISFTLVVDDFLIKYHRDEDLAHLMASLRKNYTIKCDTTADQYIGINLKWDYTERTCTLSMDGYVEQALRELEHSFPSKPYTSPSYCGTPFYSAKPQLATVDDSPTLPTSKIRYIQRAIGKLLFYARAIDLTMLHALNEIARAASKGTEATLRATKYLLNYAATNPNTEIIYRASDMILRSYSDAAYLVAPNARSRAGGYHFLSNTSGTGFNAPIFVLAKVIKRVMSSAAEAETTALFMNAQEAVHLRNILTALGWPQPQTTIITDNNTTIGFANNTIKQAKSKSWDMNTNWLKCREAQQQFNFKWDKGVHNLADYPTKHHPAKHHRAVRPIYTYIKGESPRTLARVYQIITNNN